jgi:hypothetical protein
MQKQISVTYMHETVARFTHSFVSYNMHLVQIYIADVKTLNLIIFCLGACHCS